MHQGPGGPWGEGHDKLDSLQGFFALDEPHQFFHDPFRETVEQSDDFGRLETLDDWRRFITECHQEQSLVFRADGLEELDGGRGPHQLKDSHLFFGFKGVPPICQIDWVNFSQTLLQRDVIFLGQELSDLRDDQGRGLEVLDVIAVRHGVGYSPMAFRRTRLRRWPSNSA